jgi:protein transport protein SEC13
MENDTWQVISFQDSKLGCNAISWAPHGSVGSKDDTGRSYARLVTGSCDNRVRIWRCPIDTFNAGEWTEEPLSSENPPHHDWVRVAEFFFRHFFLFLGGVADSCMPFFLPS